MNVSTNVFADSIILETFLWHSATPLARWSLHYRGAFRVSTGPDVELTVSSSSTMSGESHAAYERTRCILGGSIVACLTTVAWVTYIMFWSALLFLTPSSRSTMFRAKNGHESSRLCAEMRFNCEIKRRVLIDRRVAASSNNGTSRRK